MNSKYKILKYKSQITNKIEDLISIEEPLEISIRFKNQKKWFENIISITMRTPGNDEDLVRGFLFNERIIEKNEFIEKIEKTSLDSLEIIKKDKILKSLPKITKELIIKSPKILRDNQSEFSKTGGIHASGLFSSNGEIVSIREDVGRHNALDKLIGYSLNKGILNPASQFIACSGRLNFELVQKVLMTNIGILIGVGAPTSLAIDLANKFDITLVGFVKDDSFNIYSNEDRVILKG